MVVTVSANCTGNVLLPQTPESFGYDADGNLTNDGRWTYTWDEEPENGSVLEFLPNDLGAVC